MAKALLQKRFRDTGHLFLGRPWRILLNFSPITSSLCELECDVICYACNNTTFPGGSVVNNPLPMQETQQSQVQSLGAEDPLEEEIATHSSVLAWAISWTEKPGRVLYSLWGCKQWDTTEVTEHGIRGARGIYAITQKSDL